MGSNHLRSTLLFWPGMYLYVRNKYHSSTWCTNDTDCKLIVGWPLNTLFVIGVIENTLSYRAAVNLFLSKYWRVIEIYCFKFLQQIGFRCLRKIKSLILLFVNFEETLHYYSSYLYTRLLTSSWQNFHFIQLLLPEYLSTHKTERIKVLMFWRLIKRCQSRNFDAIKHQRSVCWRKDKLISPTTCCITLHVSM